MGLWGPFQEELTEGRRPSQRVGGTSGHHPREREAQRMLACLDFSLVCVCPYSHHCGCLHPALTFDLSLSVFQCKQNTRFLESLQAFSIPSGLLSFGAWWIPSYQALSFSRMLMALED